MRIFLPLAVTAAVLVVPSQAHAAEPLVAHAARAYGKPLIGPGKPTKVRIKAHVTGENVTAVDVRVDQSAGRGSAFARDLKRVSGTAQNGVYEGYVSLDAEDWGGRYSITVGATNGVSGEAGYDFKTFGGLGPFTVHRRAKLTVSAPKTVKKGRKLLVLGTLTGFGLKRYAPLKRRQVVLYFRPKGSKKFTRVATLTTNSKGRYSVRLMARRDGAIAAVFPGSLIWQKRVTAWKVIDVG